MSARPIDDRGAFFLSLSSKSLGTSSNRGQIGLALIKQLFLLVLSGGFLTLNTSMSLCYALCSCSE